MLMSISYGMMIMISMAIVITISMTIVRVYRCSLSAGAAAAHGEGPIHTGGMR